jgi:hypothetical protein
MRGQQTPASWDEVSQRFSGFLRENGYPEQVLWVEDTDVVWHRGQLWVRTRPKQEGCDRACQRYEEGIRNRHGVLLRAFSELGEAVVAVVVLPKDEDAAQRHLIPRGGIKLSAATNKLNVRRVSNRLTWLILSVCHRTASRLFRDDYLKCS